MSQNYFKRQQDYLGHVNGHVEEMYGGHVVMKAFNGEAKSVEQFDGLNNTLYDSAWKSQFLSGLMFPIMNFVGNLGYVAICILGGYLAISNAITVGDIQAFIQYVRSFTQPITQIANISNILQQTAACGRARLRVPGRTGRSARQPPTRSSWKRCRAAWISRTSTSATARIRSSSMISPPTSNPARRSPSSARPAPARPPWSNC